MNLVADAVAGAGEIDPVAGGCRLQVAVIIGVLKTALQGIVIDIAHREFGANPLHAHPFKLQVGHGAGGILGQRLIDLYGDLLSRFKPPGEEMFL